ncbi:endoplasmic oxidoreductin [Piromyces finnis]|uniref:Endoplasmic oxidoreductin n=1 Tax=Piromyces finnis TaxID=1754191 RepID=A0A1Y1VCK1_9FUNG|nr:endoplasmic oxidoreductin [Piromyces finnis]|eukprot:ORX52916.1 endoplasmic oxidoreductin [Piromyces finnis]
MKFKQLSLQLLGLISTSLLVKGDEIVGGRKDNGYCCFEGDIADCQCKYESVEEMNKVISPILGELVESTFFRYYKVDLWKECQFWPDADLLCTSERCSVPSVEEEKIPEEWKVENLSKIEKSSIYGASSMFGNCDYSSNEFCVFDEDSNGIRYVDLPTNPEKYTGYTGDSATRVWKAIYNENCFGVPNQLGEETCLEKRVYYKLISGLHASISTNVCYYWLDTKTGVWGHNVDCFIWKIGKFPDRVENIYLNYAIYIRAINKISKYLSNYTYCNGNDEEDVKVSELVKKVIDVSKDYPSTFNENQFFNSPETKELLNDTKFQFRNVTRIMDCVACEKCRLWGKLQVTGLGTALKILFSTDDVNSVSLKRSEIVAFINGFNKLSSTIKMIDEFRGLWREKEEGKATSDEKRETETETENDNKEKKEEDKLEKALLDSARKIAKYVDWVKDTVFNALVSLKLVDPNNKELKDKIGFALFSAFSISIAMFMQVLVLRKAFKNPKNFMDDETDIKSNEKSTKENFIKKNSPPANKSKSNLKKKSKKIN